MITDFIHLMPLKVKELRNKADEGASLAVAHMQHGLDPPRNLPEDFPDLLTFMAKLYASDSYGMRLDYWRPLLGQTSRPGSANPPITAKQVGKFVYWRTFWLVFFLPPSLLSRLDF